jgi:hypothetical protein
MVASGVDASHGHEDEIDPEVDAEVSQGLESAYQELEVAYNRFPSVEDFRIEKFLGSPGARLPLGPAVDDLLAAALSMPKVAQPKAPRRGGAPTQKPAGTRSRSQSIGAPSPRATTPPPASVSSNGINRTRADARIEQENQALSARLARVRPTVPRASTPQRGTPRTAR